jgi:glucokinase
MSEEMMYETQSLPVIGVDLGGTQIRVAVLHGNKLLSRVGLLTGSDSTPKSVIPRIYDAMRQALEEANMSLDQIEGIGIGVPGLVNSSAGIVFEMPNLQGWNNLRLRNILEKDFHIKTPIFIDNDANAAALGEYLFGAGRGCNSMVYLTISTGLGGGVIINGQIMRGVSGTAMEIGHMVIQKSGEPCNCGNFGCLESVASGIAIARHARSAIASDQGIELRDFARSLWTPNIIESNDSASLFQNPSVYEQEELNEAEELQCIDARIVAKAAEARVPEARDIIEKVAKALGIGLVNVIHIFNPERIILGGSLIQIGPLLLDPALRIVQERAMEVPRRAVSIVEAQLHQNVGLVGAGALVYHNMGMSIKLS